jgi:hypothetical protein
MNEILAFLEKLLPVWAMLLVGGFGYLLVLLKRASDRFTEIADRQNEYMKDRVDALDKSTGIFTRTIDQQEKEIQTLQEQLRRISANVQATRETDARLSVQELTLLAQGMERLAAVQNETLRLVAAKSNSNLELRAPVEPETHLADRVQTDLRRAIRARDLSIYPVLVAGIRGAKKIVTRLREAGYAASLYAPETKSDAAHSEGIWVGAALPPDMAIEMIKLARSVWPFLKYVHLSTDSDGPEETHTTMFLGGSSESAKGFLGCLPWTDQDFDGLSEEMAVADFHAYIRRHYRTDAKRKPDDPSIIAQEDQ